METNSTIDMGLSGPYRSTTLELVFGSMEYVRSVFGEGTITRQQLIDHYARAEDTWHKMEIPFGIDRKSITGWCQAAGIGSLHYYAPMGHKHIFFKDKEDALAFKLRWGY